MRILRLVVLVLVVALTATLTYGEKITVMDRDDGLPIAGVTLLSEVGHILGITDKNGVAELHCDTDYPFTLRCVGYEMLTVTAHKDTLFLNSAEYALPEVSVTISGRPFRRVIWYAREYSTGSTGLDTMQLYSEYMLESFIVDHKVKGYHSSDARLKTKSVKRYARISGVNRNDSVFIPGEKDDITILAWGGTFCKLPDGRIEETQAIRAGAMVDSVAGEYAIDKVLQKGGGRYLVISDWLSGHKNHSWSPTLFKIFGMTIDIDRYDSSFCFQQNEHGIYDMYDLMYSSLNLNILARGKIFKWLFRSSEPLRMNTCIELYPVEITSHSHDEYRELRKDKSPLEFQIPLSVLPEMPAVSELKHSVSSIYE